MLSSSELVGSGVALSVNVTVKFWLGCGDEVVLRVEANSGREGPEAVEVTMRDAFKADVDPV